jgi:hypothetical protein
MRPVVTRGRERLFVPFALAIRRVRSHAQRSLLVATGIAAGAAMLAMTAVGSVAVQLRAAQPVAPTTEEIEALLDSVPDLRAVMRQAPPDELTELFAAFDLTATYDKKEQALRLAATLSPALIPPSERPRPPKEAVGELFHSGGRI